jgi:hypothetical protein
VTKTGVTGGFEWTRWATERADEKEAEVGSDSVISKPCFMVGGE